MKTVTKIILIAVAVLVVVFLLSLAGKIVTGTFHLLESAFGTVLGVILVLALVAIVLWMFLYAKNAKKEKEAAKGAEIAASPVSPDAEQAKPQTAPVLENKTTAAPQIAPVPDGKTSESSEGQSLS